ncbi:glycosyltransferase [Pseudonocardia acidicola]|uniref:Glycosyltransferase family 4 protein n=1 Tax=Pseudonocardia acidicola TaxID=2724939 RepID=A0ABX1S9Y7_9PSEU|nr:glycosyltransferase family 4 protein [Pseudonocardia acidicola]
MRILCWHVHGSWSTAFVQGPHTYVVPVTPPRDADGRGRAQTFRWPSNALEMSPDELRDEDFDAIVLQRERELELCEKWLGRRPGRDVPAVYVEHDTPRGAVPDVRHPLADRTDVPIVHVTHFNALMWDNGRAPVRVVEHGIPDPGHRYTGRLDRVGVVINEPVRRWRVAGTDLLPRLSAGAPTDVFGMHVTDLPATLGPGAGDRLSVHEDLPQSRMHAELAQRRLYLHPFRWTSLGLSLIEAMQLGLPVVALGATAAFEAIPQGTGIVSTRIDVLAAAVRDLLHDPARAREIGAAGRTAALQRHGLQRFLREWDSLLQEVTT